MARGFKTGKLEVHMGTQQKGDEASILHGQTVNFQRSFNGTQEYFGDPT